jgi:hypothetical protein
MRRVRYSQPCGRSLNPCAWFSFARELGVFCSRTTVREWLGCSIGHRAEHARGA